MLTFLAIAEFQGFRVEQYSDSATGYLEKIQGAEHAVTRIELRPVIEFSGEKQPDEKTLKWLHAGAHKNCFIAKSLNTEVIVMDA